MTLTYRQDVRVENDPVKIAAMLKKDWVQNEPPSHDPATQHAPTWNGEDWQIVEKTPEEIAAANRKTWTPAQFLARFTASEIEQFLIQQRTNVSLALLHLKLTTEPEIVSDNSQLLAAMDALVEAGIITTERKLAILHHP